MSVEAEEKKGYVKSIISKKNCLRFTHGAECEWNIMLNNYGQLGLWNSCSMYVAGIHGKNKRNMIFFFEGQIGEILEGDWGLVMYIEKHLGCELFSRNWAD